MYVYTMVVPLLANSFALQFLGIYLWPNTQHQHPCDTNIISVRHLIEASATVVDRLGVYHTRIQCLNSYLAIGKYMVIFRL